MALVRRDPFAREELHRETVPAQPDGCCWCGGTNARGRVYVYRVETDSGRAHPIGGRFCSEGCRRSFAE